MHGDLPCRCVMDRTDKIRGAGKTFVGGKEPVQEVIGFRQAAQAGAEKDAARFFIAAGMFSGAVGQTEGHDRKPLQAADQGGREVISEFLYIETPLAGVFFFNAVHRTEQIACAGKGGPARDRHGRRKRVGFPAAGFLRRSDDKGGIVTAEAE